MRFDIRRRRGALLLLPILLLIMARPAHPAPAVKVFTDADKGSTVQLKTGDFIELRLEANPSTGYMWYMQAKSTRLVKLRSQSQTEPAQPGVVGQPVYQIFRFEAVGSGDGAGQTHLKLV